MSALRLRAATAADAPLVLEFIRHLAVYEKLLHEVRVTEEDIRRALFGESPAAEVVLALDGDDPVGFALYYTNYSTFLGKPGVYLEDLFVHPRARGRGAGRALLAHLARLTAERGGRLVWAVLDWNEPAIGFYESLGAEAMDEWRTFRLQGEALRRLAEEER